MPAWLPSAAHFFGKFHLTFLSKGVFSSLFPREPSHETKSKNKRGEKADIKKSWSFSSTLHKGCLKLSTALAGISIL